jgi:hypothetical protein
VAGRADPGDGVVGEVGPEPVVALDQPLEVPQRAAGQLEVGAAARAGQVGVLDLLQPVVADPRLEVRYTVEGLTPGTLACTRSITVTGMT